MLALPAICIQASSENLSHAQFAANFQGDQIFDDKLTAVIFSKIIIHMQQKSSFFLLARDYLLQKSKLLNTIQITVSN